MTKHDPRLIETVQALADAFVASGREVSADTTVPTCPDWTMAALTDHVALELAAWYYSNLTLAPGTADPIAAAMATAPERGDGYAALIDYVDMAAARFAERAQEVDLDADVWVFDDIGPARFWLCQTVLEVGLHADDAARAVGHPSPLEAEIATEAIGQYVENLAHHGRWWGEPHAPPPQPIGIVATDTASAWLVRADGNLTVGTPGHGDEESNRIAAPAVDLLRWLTGREPDDPPEILGEVSPALDWQAVFR